ncbi:AtpZ/AtpI family protein [Mucilaginibacter limnophilus]|uniref:AtpZ/AtpI family protein n=1 Tax=Mucilaginibacter limnophilus TaxID=1932778 RepID=A0A3S2Y465_9SPHI|nr:AtpZ/AtpI family protein [Mucilaginibacter limnophilus]RVU01584.1 AtpZ/AtpI family protein [Mucilaginibacter limnophilus]
MAENEQNNNDSPGSGLQSYAKWTGLGIQMMVVIGGLGYLGYRIDKANNHNIQWVAATLALAGVFISLYLIIRATKS